MILNLTGLARQHLDAGLSYLEAAMELANDLAQVGERGRADTATIGAAVYRPSYNPGTSPPGPTTAAPNTARPILQRAP